VANLDGADVGCSDGTADGCRTGVTNRASEETTAVVGGGLDAVTP
jgi:hypothetical protein